MSKRTEIAEYLQKYVQDNGASPTIEDIKKAVGLKSGSTVWYHLKRLGLADNWVNKKTELAKGVCPTCLRKL